MSWSKDTPRGALARLAGALARLAAADAHRRAAALSRVCDLLAKDVFAKPLPKKDPP